MIPPDGPNTKRSSLGAASA